MIDLSLRAYIPSFLYTYQYLFSASKVYIRKLCANKFDKTIEKRLRLRQRKLIETLYCFLKLP